ncbi:hypothetical protein MKZ38_003726 [Zalerion maritima]|uniref:Uncharacterized protein n=1 Tax=Zalerion maritima TaxID=339359 RepID=A0AAD5RWU8_9PEZI|nr:hypothetical protein MKZ38_003726 [Zalerion maritima]
MVSTRSASRAGTPAAMSHSTPTPKPRASKPSASPSTFVHSPPPILLAWLFVSLPLVAWDTVYVLGRPHTMPGGKFHQPLYRPYALYGTVDYVYGFKAYNEGNGFTGAQGAMNLVETILYVIYLWMWYANRTTVAASKGGKDGGKTMMVLTGRTAAKAVLICFAAAVMTLSKTGLYWLNEYCSGFDNIGHNDMQSLLLLWVVPNGLWIVFPSYMIYTLGGKILSAMTAEPIKRS